MLAIVTLHTLTVICHRQGINYRHLLEHITYSSGTHHLLVGPQSIHTKYTKNYLHHKNLQGLCVPHKTPFDLCRGISCYQVVTNVIQPERVDRSSVTALGKPTCRIKNGSIIDIFCVSDALNSSASWPGRYTPDELESNIADHQLCSWFFAYFVQIVLVAIALVRRYCVLTVVHCNLRALSSPKNCTIMLEGCIWNWDILSLFMTW